MTETEIARLPYEESQFAGNRFKVHLDSEQLKELLTLAGLLNISPELIARSLLVQGVHKELVVQRANREALRQ